MNASRIPEYDPVNPDGILIWFSKMAVRDLLFHPENPPENIMTTNTGEHTFNKDECHELDAIPSSMFAAHGDGVVEACYPVFVRKAGFHLRFDA